jgi:hypothetical protein
MSYISRITFFAGLTTLPHSCVDCLEICGPQPPETLSACTGNTLPYQSPQIAQVYSVQTHQFLSQEFAPYECFLISNIKVRFV